MVDPKNGWLSMGVLSTVGVILSMIAAVGCATPEAPVGDGANSPGQVDETVSVWRDGAESVVTLAGLVDPVALQQEDAGGNVLVIEVVGGVEGLDDSAEEQLAAYDGVVDLVSVSTYDDAEGEGRTRVEVVTAVPAEATVVTTESSLEIRIAPSAQEAEVAILEADEPAEGEAQGVDLLEPTAAVVIPDPPTAKTLTAVEAEAYGEGVLVSLETDGAIGAIEAFTLENPARLVVDLPGVSSAESLEGVSVGSDLVDAVRLGVYPDKVRVVIDGGEAAADFAGRQLMPGTTGLWIAVGSGEVLSQAVESALAASEDAWRASALAEASAVQQSNEAEGATAVEAAEADELAGVVEGVSDAPGIPVPAIDTLPAEETVLGDSTPEGDFEEASSESPGEGERLELGSSALALDAEGADSGETVLAMEETEVIEASLASDPAGSEVSGDHEVTPLEASEATPKVADADVEEADLELAEVESWADEPVEPTVDLAVPAADVEDAALDLAQIYGLHYERSEGLDRTAILADDTVAYSMSSPDAGTFVLSIPGAQISEAASDRIFPEAGGPVSLIHAFQQPELETPEVRVVFTRAPGQEPAVSRRGSMLFVDFVDLGVPAAAPPAFPSAGAATAALEAEIVETVTVDEAPTASAIEAPVAAPTNATSEPTPVAAIATPVAPLEVVAAMEGEFAPDDALDVLSAPDPSVAWDGSPAAVEVPAAIEVLEEGGLIDGKEYQGRRVSLDFKDVAIADVLRLIAEVSDLNIIAGDEVAGNVTIRLVDVPWDQALDVILMTKGLGFVRVGNVLRIAPSDVLKAEEEVRLQERRNKEKLEDLEVKLLPVNYASVRDTEGLVKRLLSARGTVNLDERTNTLIIKDIASVIDEASALIAAIDTQTPQVMIEAKIVEASLDFSRELGSVWGIQTQRFTDPYNNPDTQRTDLDFANDGINLIDENSLAFANPIAAVPTGLMTVGALILDQDFRVDAQIQAAESTGDGKVVSSPRIVTLDNTEASIEQGVSIPFQTFEGGDAKLEFIDAVLSLIVTPHITADESIIMEIEVSRNAPDDTVPTPTGSPAIAKNQAQTETLVKDGQTLVLGGIYTITKANTESRIPYLHRIPVIGNAFKSRGVRDSRKELLVFVTPRIVRLPEMASN